MNRPRATATSNYVWDSLLRRAGDANETVAGVSPVDRVWDVFDAEGVFVGQVQLSAKVRLVQVSGQFALMIVFDAMDRSTVAIHRVRRIR